VTAQTLHHFPDKRALLLALIDDWGDRELEHRRSHHDLERFLGGEPRASFGEDLRHSYERLRREGGFYLVLLELAERDSDARQRLNRINQLGDERLCDVLALGQSRGVIRAEVDPRPAAVGDRSFNAYVNAIGVFVHPPTDPALERVLE
jgi:AcrR family transcriptional regulator